MKLKKIFVVMMLGLVLVFSATSAFANSTTTVSGEGTFGFEGVISNFVKTLQGPTAQNICIAAIIICALALIFQPDMQSWMKMLVAIVLIAACIAKASNFVGAIFGTGCLI